MKIYDSGGKEIRPGNLVRFSAKFATSGYTVTAPVVVDQEGKLTTGPGKRVSHYDGVPDKVGRSLGGAFLDSSWTVVEL